MSGFDIVLVLPYKFSDHPSFPEGVLRRVAEAEGCRVGVIEQPRWDSAADFKACGMPRLFFAVVTGPIDSIVLNYTASRKRRMEDLYQPQGNGFFPGSAPSISSRIRPDRTALVYTARIREAYRDAQVLLGGMEASGRRFGHYDFQSGKLRRSILLDSRADLLVHGMGELPLRRIISALRSGARLSELQLPGTAGVFSDPPSQGVELPSWELLQQDPEQLMHSWLGMHRALRQHLPAWQRCQNRCVVMQPPELLDRAGLDQVYALPFTRRHPDGTAYTPALQMNLFSVTTHRGCGGGCSFCAITEHEGQRIVSRSPESILAEVRAFQRHPSWRGVIGDLGGASADMYGSGCGDPCGRHSCLHPASCPDFDGRGAYLRLLRAVRREPGVKQVFVASGLRYDRLLMEPELFDEILRYHSGKFMRVAPEHSDPGVLDLMQKPRWEVFLEFTELHRRLNRGLSRPVPLYPYLITGHPGETDHAVTMLAGELKRLQLRNQDVQLFTPVPGTLSTAIWYSGIGPDLKPVPVERDPVRLQRRKELLTGASGTGPRPRPSRRRRRA